MMADGSDISSKFRENILQNLQKRNRNQCQCFSGIIHAHNRMFETVDTLKSKNVHLNLDAERLRQENLDLKVKVEAGGGGVHVGGGERTQALEQKLFNLQEELTDLHRRKGENSQQIIDLNNALQEKEKILLEKGARLSNAEMTIDTLQDAIRHFEKTVIELEATNQMLKDEQQALQMAYTSLELKFRKTMDENAELVKRWMAQKAKAADVLNEENDQMLRKRQAKLKKELAEAAEAPVKIDDKSWPGGMIPMCLSVSIPSKPQYKFDAHEGEVNAIRWSPSGRMFATGGADRKLKLWEIVGGKCQVKATLSGSNAGIMSAEFDVEENYVIGASSDFASRVWTVNDHRLRHTLTGHSGKVFAAKFFGADCHKVVSGSHDRTIKIWDLRSKACVKTIFAGSACFDLVTSDGLGTSIISGHFDKRIRFWDTRSDNSVNEISLQGRITSLDLLPDGFTLLCCSRDDALKIVDLRMNQVMGTFSHDGFKVAADWTRAVFCPDGQYVVAGSQDGAVYIWNVGTRKIEKVLSKEHNNPIMAVSWHPAGSHILSCDRQKKAVLWSDF